MKKLVAVGLAVVAAFAVSAATEDVWVGGTDLSWETDANWSDGVPGAESAVWLRDADPNATLTLGADSTVASLEAKFNQAADAPCDCDRTLDLGGHTLSVLGVFGVANYASSGNYMKSQKLSVTNGLLKIGTVEKPANLTVGTGSKEHFETKVNSGSLTVGEGGSFHGNLGVVKVGGDADRSNNGLIDLRLADRLIAGENEEGVFRANEVVASFNGKICTDCDILFGSALRKLEIRSALSLAKNGQSCTAHIGQYAGLGLAPLPEDVDILFGVSDTARCSVSIGDGGYSPSAAVFAATAGGTLTAYLSDVSVGVKSDAGTSNPKESYFILGAMETGHFDVAGTLTLGNSHQIKRCGKGVLTLPPGTATFKTVVVGAEYGGGQLTFRRTTAGFHEAGSLTVNNTGRIDVNVATTPSGLDFAEDTALAFTGNGRLYVNFTAEPESDEGVHWGLRLKGDRSTEISHWVFEGNIVAVTDGLEGSAGVFYDQETDCTYLAYRRNGKWGPSVITKDVTVELPPDVPTSVAIGISDVDLSLQDQEILSKSLTGEGDLTPEDDAVYTIPETTLSSGAEPVRKTATLTYVNSSGSSSAEATVTLVPMQPPTDGDVVWSGGATTTYLSRPELFWGMNWAGKAPPAPVTTGTATMVSDSDFAIVLDQDRQFGGLKLDGADVDHDLDLHGHTLVISNGTLAVGSTTTSANLTIHDGSLVLTNASLTLDGSGAEQNALKLSNVNLTLDADTVRISDYDRTFNKPGDVKLDLRDCTLAGGVFRARTLRISPSQGNNDVYQNGYIDFSPETGLEELVFTDEMTMCDGTRAGYARLGDSHDGWRLPTNVCLTVGVWGERRALMQIGNCPYGAKDTSHDWAYLAAAEGGTFRGYLSTFSVGYSIGAELDLTAMDSVEVDTENLWIGEGTSGRKYQAKLRLPKGDVTTKSFRCAGFNHTTVDLHGTRLYVESEANFGPSNTHERAYMNCRVNVILEGEPAGITFAEGVMPVFGEKATLTVDFARPPAPDVSFYTGLCFKGGDREAVQKLVDDGKIVIAGEGVRAEKVEVYSRSGDVYVGMRRRGMILILK